MAGELDLRRGDDAPEHERAARRGRRPQHAAEVLGQAVTGYLHAPVAATSRVLNRSTRWFQAAVSAPYWSST